MTRDSDPLNAARGIVLWLPISIALWIALALFVGLML